MFWYRTKYIKILTFFICVIFLFSILVLLLSKKFQSQGYEKCWAENRANCGENDWSTIVPLPSKDSFLRNRSVIFLEGYFHNFLSPRMLCTIESAALTHPKDSINIMMTSQTLKVTPVTEAVTEKYKNIRFSYLNATKLYLNSPLKDWFLKKKWKNSYWPQTNFNDPIRWMLLWKYGGIYLDMDVIVLKNLMKESNFAGLESEYLVGAGAISFTKKHPFIKECILKMTHNFNGEQWGANAPKLLTSTLTERCGLDLPSGRLKNCSDIKIYKQKVFYPISWKEWEKYFMEDKELSDTLIKDSEVLGIHVWNKLSLNSPILLKDSSPYALIAKTFCPVTVNEVGGLL